MNTPSATSILWRRTTPRTGVSALLSVVLLLGFQLFVSPLYADDPAANPKKKSTLPFVEKLRNAINDLRTAPPATKKAPALPIVPHFHLRGILQERPMEDPFGLSGGQTISLRPLLRRLELARNDERVTAVIVTFDQFMMGMAQAEELHQSLAQFAAVDKPVFIHAEALNFSAYTLLTGGSYLSVAPVSGLYLTGLHGKALYVKRLLEKIGIEADFLHIGDYKAAAEAFTRTSPSDEAKANMDWLFDSLYDSMVAKIADARKMTPEQVRKLIDEGPYLAKGALKAGLIDAVEHRVDFVATVKKRLGEPVSIDNRYGESDAQGRGITGIFSLVNFLSRLAGQPKSGAQNKIALIYVEGMILPGFYDPTAFGGADGAYSGDIRKALEIAGKDPAVKAVVIRVNSPGGSAQASEVIWNAIRLVKEKKPVVISMGNVAASGGYYLACGATSIYADALTITGSIGVVGGKFVVTGLWDKIGVDWAEYTRGANADIFASSRPWNDDQRRWMIQHMEEVYTTFTEHVETGRQGKLQKPIAEIAGGRVFAGEHAKALGLIDQIGGLDAAIAFAANTVKVSDYEVVIIPRHLDFLTSILTAMQGTGERPSDIHSSQTMTFAHVAATPPWPLLPLIPLLQQMTPDTAAALRRVCQQIVLINREGVVTLMPHQFMFH